VRSSSAETDKETKKMLVYGESLARGCFHRQEMKLGRENVKKRKTLNKKVKKRKKPGPKDE
jgi:hypothetical protein